MKYRFVVLMALAAVLLVAGVSAFADSGQGMTPSYAAPWSAQYQNEATGVSGAVAVQSDSATSVVKDADIASGLQDQILPAGATTIEPSYPAGSSPNAAYLSRQPLF